MTAGITVIKPTPLSDELELLADRTTSEKWSERFKQFAAKASRLESAVTEGRWQIQELQAQLANDNAEEEEHWQRAAHLFDEMHRALGHESSVTLCSVELCKRAAAVLGGR